MRSTMRKVMVSMIFVFVVFCLYSQSIYAQTEQGDVELQLQGLIQVGVSDFGFSSSSIFATVGYFFTSNQEVGGMTLFMVYFKTELV